MIALEPAKRASEVRGQQHDWTDWLGVDDTISSQTTTATGVTVDSSAIDAGDKSITFYLSGGTDGTTATITQTIVTAGGRTETEIFVLRIGADEPVTLREAKSQCAMLEDDSQDEFIVGLIPAARAHVERVTRYSFVAGTRTEVFNVFGDFLEIAWRNVSAVGPDITYTDEAGADATYSAFLAKLGRYPLRIYPGIDASFPALGDGGIISVPVTLGALGSSTPEYLTGKRAILLLIGYWFNNRGEVPLDKDTELAMDCLLDDLRPISAY